jgi:hypothetical protein
MRPSLFLLLQRNPPAPAEASLVPRFAFAVAFESKSSVFYLRSSVVPKVLPSFQNLKFAI